MISLNQGYKQIMALLVIFLLISISTTGVIGTQENLNNENIGRITTYKDGCCEGYTLLNILPSKRNFKAQALLIDMNGNEINQWFCIPFPAKILPGGSIIAGNLFRDPDEVKQLVQYSWNGTVEWEFSDWDDAGTNQMMARQHHDFQREGNPVGYYAPGQDFIINGKTLVLAHKNIRNKSISWRKLVDDVIYEVDWNGDLTGFKWIASEHFDEMVFNDDEKRGIRINPGFYFSGDWLHTNSISELGENIWYDQGDERFHPDNIILDCRNANFIAIINRTNGSIVWKIGPDYSGESNNNNIGQIIGQHHAHMIPKGLPGEGNILVFDNGGWSGYGSNLLPQYIRYYFWYSCYFKNVKFIDQCVYFFSFTK